MDDLPESGRIRSGNRQYVPPYDSGERHIPGYNFCGPGTNVHRRLREGVEPINELDRACLMHDLHTEPRGPYLSAGDPVKIAAADSDLQQQAGALAGTMRSQIDRQAALLVVVAMQANRLRASRGGVLPPLSPPAGSQRSKS